MTKHGGVGSVGVGQAHSGKVTQVTGRNSPDKGRPGHSKPGLRGKE